MGGESFIPLKNEYGARLAEPSAFSVETQVYLTMYQIIQETKADWWEVEALYDNVFGPGRTGLSSYRLRDDVDPVAELCFVARDDLEILGGCIRFWPVVIGSARALLLGPIAVHPTRQGEGLGGMLIAHALDHARDLGWERVLLALVSGGFDGVSGLVERRTR